MIRRMVLLMIDNRFDAGLGIGANFWIARHFEISTGYEFGLVKVNKDISDDSQNRNFYANLHTSFNR